MPTLRVKQEETDKTLSREQVARLRRGDLLGDGMSHGGGEWSWTRVRVVANDRTDETLVIRWPDGNYWVAGYEEAAHVFARWTGALDSRAPFRQDGMSTWAANAA